MSILRNEYRVGNFTSGTIYKLMSLDRSGKNFGAPALTYIHEKNLERKLGISLATETDARALSWGKLLEDRIFNMLGTEYTMTSTETDVHPEIDFWAGSKDGTKEAKIRSVIDFKAPFTRKSFCQLVMPLYCGLSGIEAIFALIDGFEHDGVKYPPHPDGEKYFYQLVSNGLINGTSKAELIVYMPYQSELAEVYQLAKERETCRWMNYATEDEMPYLPDGGFFKNLNIISFDIPSRESELLKENVLKAGQMLIQRPQQLPKAA